MLKVYTLTLISISVNFLDFGGLSPGLPLFKVLDHWFGLGFVKDASVDLHGADKVRVDVGGRSSVLDVALTVGVSG